MSSLSDLFWTIVFVILFIIGIVLGVSFLIGTAQVARTVYEKYSCPRVATLYDTEYKITMGDCYLKTPNGNWLTDIQYKKLKFVDSVNLNDEAKMLLIKDIDK
jgi:hypothetical protein